LDYNLNFSLGMWGGVDKVGWLILKSGRW
jgi:hypothetical protein